MYKVQNNEQKMMKPASAFFCLPGLGGLAAGPFFFHMYSLITSIVVVVSLKLVVCWCDWSLLLHLEIMVFLFSILLSVCLYFSTVAASLSTVEKYSLYVGDTLTNITKETFPIPSRCKGCDISLAFLNLHENENTSVVAVRSFLLFNGGSLVKFSKGNSRLVSFKIGSAKYSVDPNRIFTPEGIEATLKQYSSYSTAAAAEVSKLADFLLDVYDFENQTTVLALHDNGGSYGANSYLPGQTYENDAAAVNIVEGTNPSDFFYVVDPVYYEALKKAGYNIVLQDDETVSNDGSLSYFAGLKGKAYINFEAQAEYTAVGEQVVIQLDMIAAVSNMLAGN